MKTEFSFDMLPDECWWGGRILDAEKMPFDAQSDYRMDLLNDMHTQTTTLFISSKGRCLWSDEPYRIAFDGGVISVSGPADIALEQPGKTLRDAYLHAMRAHFPFEKDIHCPREFFEHPQFNTWMELIKNQNERDILSYAQEIVQNGYKPGILMIDGGWQKAQGVWEFNPELISDPKGLFKKLHDLGFIVMIWVSPFVCSEGDPFLNLYTSVSSENRNGDAKLGNLLRVKDGEAAIQHWWSGFGAILNFNLDGDRAFMAESLQKLMDMGVDGFKFDGGTYRPDSFINGNEFYGGYTHIQLNQAWVRFGAAYRFHEYKDTFNMGGKPIIQRLLDKSHTWQDNGLDCLIPHGVFAGLIGCPFICPDMVGGGDWTAFVYGQHDEELFVRMAQASALFPMMQFSSLPWRHLSADAAALCREMAALHERMYPEIERILQGAETTGEPIVRSMEYQFPGCGYERIRDQFMLGDAILVAPVVTQGAVSRVVHFPEGVWHDERGNAFTGPCIATVDAPLHVLPWYRRIEQKME